MSDQTIVIIAGTAWIVFGVGLAVFMGRRGHNAFGWGVIGALVGPLALALAIEAVLDERKRRIAVLEPGVPAHGTVDVLVGYDGSAESSSAADAALDILGSGIHRVTLATVREYDGATGADRTARERLESEVVRLGGKCGALILTGRPADELLREANEGGYDLLVVGARGHGLSKAVLGSVATKLAGNAKVPVLVAGPGR